MTRGQLMMQVPNHNVTKNLTGHRMHVEGPQIYEMNRQTNNFQNMCTCHTQKLTVRSQNRLFWWTQIWVT